VFHDTQWSVTYGELVPGPGRPRKGESRLFKVIGEKLPIESLDRVKEDLTQKQLSHEGVYVAHDSMGYARYVGRGQIFTRLKSRAKQSKLEIKYYSFYVVQTKLHEREIETLLIRVAAPMLYFNERKKRLSLSRGNIGDYEPGTQFYERNYKKGRKAKRRKKR
jgi:hypothetical protein